jgi:hypothetical protein
MSAFSAFLNQPIEILLYQLTIWFGWVSVAFVLGWGFLQMWKNERQGQYVQTLKHVLLAINVPAQTEQTPKAVENLFSSLIGAYSNFNWKERWIVGKVQPVFSFEIVSTEGYIQFLVWTQTKFRDLIEADIYAQYPEAEITEVEDYASIAPKSFPDEAYDAWGAEITTKGKDHFPIRTYLDFEDRVSGEYKDPLGQILEMFGKMRPGEHLWLQLVLQPQGNDWKEPGVKFINKLFGVEEKHKPGAIESGLKAALFLPSAVLEEFSGISLLGQEEHKEADPWRSFKLSPVQKEQAEGTLQKIKKVGHACKIRIVYLARHEAYQARARLVREGDARPVQPPEPEQLHHVRALRPEGRLFLAEVELRREAGEARERVPQAQFRGRRHAQVPQRRGTRDPLALPVRAREGAARPEGRGAPRRAAGRPPAFRSRAGAPGRLRARRGPRAGRARGAARPVA